VSYTGETGYELYMAPADQPAVFDQLCANEHEEQRLALCGLRTLMMLRLEKSYPAWGLEITSDYYAHECGLMDHVKCDKGDFIGRSAVMNYPPPRERMITLTVDASENAIWGDEAIFLDGAPVGYVSSGGWGPVVDQHIALGYVPVDAYKEHGRYAVEILGNLYPAILQTEAMYDPAGQKMRI
jgi:dimethylglycine dehydrogenase